MRVAMLLAALALFDAGCATQKEARHLRVENELLREQVRIIRKNCSYYRDLQITPEKEEAPGDSRSRVAADERARSSSSRRMRSCSVP